MVADLMRLFVPFEERFGASEPFVVNAPLSEAIWTGEQYVYTVSIGFTIGVPFDLRLT